LNDTIITIKGNKTGRRSIKKIFPSGNRKHHEKTEVCEVSKGEGVKIWRTLEIIPKFPHIKWNLKKNGRRRDVKYQHLNICNLYVKSAEIINNNINKMNVCIMQFSHIQFPHLYID